LDGDFALRLRGNGPDLQGLVEALRFRMEAPVKPSLTTRPLNQPPGQQRGTWVILTMGKLRLGKMRVNMS